MTTKIQTKPTFDIYKFIVALLLPLAAGAIGSLATNSEIQTWYADLAKPSFNPPNWVFGPVRTVLYILQGIAFYLVINQNRKSKKLAGWLFVLQLIANLGWSLIFFGAHSPTWALVDIVVLWSLIVATIYAFWGIRPLAAKLLTPYLAWVTFATALNIGVIVLNR